MAELDTDEFGGLSITLARCPLDLSTEDFTASCSFNASRSTVPLKSRCGRVMRGYSVVVCVVPLVSASHPNSSKASSRALAILLRF